MMEGIFDAVIQKLDAMHPKERDELLAVLKPMIASASSYEDLQEKLSALIEQLKSETRRLGH